MKLPREVQINIRLDGTVEVVTHGFRGESCVALTKIFEAAIAGPEPLRDTNDVVQVLQPEYYQQEEAQENTGYGRAT